MKGNGDKIFSAGADIKDYYQAANPQNLNDQNANTQEEMYSLQCLANYRQNTMKPFQVCFWDGLVSGNGVSLSINAPVRIATENARLEMPNPKVGLFTDGAVTWHLSKLRSNIGTYLGVSGMPLVGKDLVRAGLANYYIESKYLGQLQNDIKEFAKNEDKSQVHIDEFYTEILSKYATEIDPSEKIDNEDMIDKIFSESQSMECIIKAIVKNENQDKQFCKKLLQNIENNSPLGMKVSLEKLKRYSSGEIDKVLAMKEDLYTGINFMNNYEFNEGVRNAVAGGEGARAGFRKLEDVGEEEVDKYVCPKGHKYKAYFL